VTYLLPTENPGVPIQILSEIAESEAEIISGKGIEQDDFFNQLKDDYRK